MAVEVLDDARKPRGNRAGLKTVATPRLSAGEVRCRRRAARNRFGEQSRDAFLADPNVQTSAGGVAIVYFLQQYETIPVFASHVAVHLDSGEVLGEFGAVEDVHCKPASSAAGAVVSGVGAFSAARRSLGMQSYRQFRSAKPRVRASASAEVQRAHLRVNRDFVRVDHPATAATARRTARMSPSNGRSRNTGWAAARTRR